MSTVSLTTTQQFSTVEEAQQYLESLEGVNWFQIQSATSEYTDESYETTTTSRVNTTPTSSSVQNTHLHFEDGGDNMSDFKIKKYMNGYVLRHKSNTQAGFPSTWKVDGVSYSRPLFWNDGVMRGKGGWICSIKHYNDLVALGARAQK